MPGKVTISYKELCKDISAGTKILVDDGKIELKVKQIEGTDIHCTVINGGMLGNRKSINIPKTHINLPALKEKDIQDLKDGCKADFDFIAASFVRNADDVQKIREVLDANGGKEIKIISKIENQEGIDNFAEILKVSDGIMIARGDLGVEIPIEMVPVMQKIFIKDCQKAGKIVITATQMLESMTEKPRPTRAEVSDVANAVYDITGAIMLSGESAQGKYPVECVELMSRISKAVEKNLHYDRRFKSVECREYDSNYEFKLNHAACATAIEIGAKAIIAYTETGDTPSILSGFLTGLPIYAITSNEKTYRQLALTWGVFPVLLEEKMHPEAALSRGIEILKGVKALKEGDIVIIAGGASILNDKTYSIMNRTMGGALKI